MLKRILILGRLLCLLLALGLPGPGLAEGIRLVPIDPAYEAVNEVLFVRDRIILHSMSGTVYGWQPGQAEFLPLFDTPMIPEDYPRPIDMGSMSTEERERFGRYILRLFTDGQDLYGLNVFTGTWARVGPEGTFWQETRLDTRALRPEATEYQVISLFAHGGFLFGLTVQEPLQPMAKTPHSLVVVSLGSGESRVLEDLPILCAAPYREGRLLLLVQGPEEEKPRLLALDPGSLATSPLSGGFPEAGEYNGLAYDGAADSIYVAIPGALLKAQAGQDFEIHSSLPFDFLAGGQPGAVLEGGYYALRLMAVALVPTGGAAAAPDTASLRLRGHALLEPGLMAFRAARPDVIIQWDPTPIRPAEAGALIRGGDRETDLYVMALDPALSAMLQKGYGADLSASPVLHHKPSENP